MGDEKVLTKEIAEQFLADEDSVNLGEFTAIEDAAAESLSNYEGDVALSGLSQLSDSAAVSLSKHKGCLSLSGLTHLSFAAAQMIIGKELLTESNAEQFRIRIPINSRALA